MEDTSGTESWLAKADDVVTTFAKEQTETEVDSDATKSRLLEEKVLRRQRDVHIISGGSYE
jgi:hypothetical protein